MYLVLHSGISCQQLASGLQKENNIFCLLKIRCRQFFFIKFLMDLGIFLEFFVLIYFGFCSLFLASILKVTSFVQSAIDPRTWSKVNISCHISGKFSVTSIPCP